MYKTNYYSVIRTFRNLAILYTFEHIPVQRGHPESPQTGTGYIKQPQESIEQKSRKPHTADANSRFRVSC